MAFVRPKARILETTTTASNGPYTLAGAADGSYNTFSSFLANGDTCYATVVEPGVAFWSGIVTYASAGNTITLTTIDESKGTFGSGTKEIFAGTLALRGMFAEDISGQITTGGTSTAYTATSFSKYASLAKLHGNMVVVVVHATNGAGGVTLVVDGLTAKPWRLSPGVELPQGTLVQGTPYPAYYNNTDGAFYMPYLAGNPFGTPLGGTINGYFSSPPNASFVAPNGQALSRTTYAGLFSLIGTTYGSGNGTTTFNIPDETGCVEAMVEASASRLTSSGWTGNSTTIGSRAGADSIALVTGELPSHSHTNTLNESPHTHNIPMPVQGSLGGGSPTSTALQGNNGSGASVVNFTSTSASTGITITNANAGGGGAHKNVQPTIIKSRFLRVL